MTQTQLPGPGLSEEQWRRLKALATSLTPEQSNWVGGYFTGYADAVRQGAAIAPPAEISVPSGQRSLVILYGSETGNGRRLAEAIVAQAAIFGLSGSARDMADYKPAALKQEQDLLIISSTHGEGEPPQPAQGFFEFLESRKAPRLTGLRFAVMALGDSTYEFYCEAGKRLDRRLEELGGERLASRIDCDVDQLTLGKNWASQVMQTLTKDGNAVPATAASPTIVPTAQSFDETNPYQAEVLENLIITGRGSSKQTRHLELGLLESGLSYQPGDTLGIVGQNDPRVVAELLGCMSFDPATAIEIDGVSTSVGAAFATRFEIATATPRFLSQWADLSGATALAELNGPGKAAERVDYLQAHHVIDIARLYPVPGLSAQSFVAGLRALQPRLYSIASSQAAQDGDVHLTVSTVRYQLHGTERVGVVSGGLSRLGSEPATLPVYIKASPHFRLPADDVPIIMIGAGTGVAPYRAFMQEREVRGATGRSWLMFGDRNFRSDFLYQAEWQAQLKAGILSRMDVAFSRDGAAKTYVQHRLRDRASDLYAWLEEGAHLYVCGDAKDMAPDVHQALLGVVATAGGMSASMADTYVNALLRDGRYQRDVY